MPTEESGSGTKRRVSVTTHRTMEMDVTRVEWVDANILPDERCQIIEVETGESLYDDI